MICSMILMAGAVIGIHLATLRGVNSAILRMPQILGVFTYQDTFDHDKGQKSAISGRCLHWILLNFLHGVDYFSVSPGFLCSLVRKNRPKALDVDLLWAPFGPFGPKVGKRV